MNNVWLWFQLVSQDIEMHVAMRGELCESRNDDGKGNEFREMSSSFDLIVST